MCISLHPQSIVVEPVYTYLRVLDNFMAIQLNIPSKSVYGLRDANAHVYHLVTIIMYMSK